MLPGSSETNDNKFEKRSESSVPLENEGVCFQILCRDILNHFYSFQADSKQKIF